MGDKQNTIKKLQVSAKSVKFADKLDFEQVNNGSPKEYMKLYQYLFCEYSPVISAEVTGKHQVDLNGKDDKPFMEFIYRLIRDMFDYVPKLTRDQFFTTSYAQVKAMMAIDIIDLVQKKLKTPPTAGSSSASSSVSGANPILSSTQNGTMNTTSTVSHNLTSKTSKTNLKSENNSENGSSKPNGHHLPPKSSRPPVNGQSSGSSELATKLESLMSRLAIVEKYCQEISRDNTQSKESRTFKDDDEVVNGDGEIELDTFKSNEAIKQDEMTKSYESQIYKEEFEKLASRVTNIERSLVNFELKQNVFYRKFEKYVSEQEQKKDLRRNNSFCL